MDKHTQEAPVEVGLFTAHVVSDEQAALLAGFCKANGIDYEPDVD